MGILRYVVVNIIGTLLRGFPFPCKTGLVKIGNPDEHSPVFLTCNYSLTVERVKRALKGIDCYLLIANSRGINVWCAAAGGHLTNHDVISALKLSGIEKIVEHRNVILPQLAAAGIETKVIKDKSGWNIIWGPVYARDIIHFIRNNFEKTPDMREVNFPLLQRIEMAVMWAFPFSLIIALITTPLWPQLLLPLLLLVWFLPLLIFISFPIYSKWLNPKKKITRFSKYTVIFVFGRIPLIFAGISIFILAVYETMMNTFNWKFILSWFFVSFVIILSVSIDLMGSTPVYKSSLHEERFLKVVLEKKKCRGCGICQQVCPRNCYEIDGSRHIAMIARENQCVQCGACIVQCPFDALHFESPQGKIILPEVIRKFKLNLIGKRLVKVKKS